MIHRILAALGLQLAEPSKERDLLNRLAACTTNDEQYLATLHQAVLIAQMGGTTDEKLEALLALGATEMMMPYTERALNDVGIDTRPWAMVQQEQEAATPTSTKGTLCPHGNPTDVVVAWDGTDATTASVIGVGVPPACCRNPEPPTEGYGLLHLSPP